MGLTETSLGIIPGAGGTQRLSRLIGVSRAKELIFSASRIGTARAAEIGLVNVMVPAGQALQKSVTLAASIAAQGPLAVRLAKEAIDLGLEVSLEEGMKHEGRCYGLTIGSQDRLEGLAAFQEKRPPRFVGK
jgi:methylglutaconyl-CoA hydratase